MPAVAYPPRIKVFVTNTGSRNLTVYDTRTTHLLAVAAGPSRVYVTNYSDNTVTVITRSPRLVTRQRGRHRDRRGRRHQPGHRHRPSRSGSGWPASSSSSRGGPKVY
ncbi:hypothetical protein GCM10022380_72850 [Amycolatopsis tucumanensis]|uniref:40-residue YVTN family beta-propeller repeat-containing protein n=1 Tax=Amycolatopsis tucumanensis TaxID=401106 RepID=A0ABP7JHW4_9PSEU